MIFKKSKSKFIIYIIKLLTKQNQLANKSFYKNKIKNLSF